jgi:hypothetical protein
MELPSGRSLDEVVVGGAIFAAVLVALHLVFDLVRARKPRFRHAALEGRSLLLFVVALEFFLILPDNVQRIAIAVTFVGATVLAIVMSVISNEPEREPGPLPAGLRPPLPSERSSVLPEEASFR